MAELRKLYLVTAIALLLFPATISAAQANKFDIVLENKLLKSKYFTLERMDDGTDIIKEEDPAYKTAHLRFIDHIQKALNAVYEKHKQDLESLTYGSMVVVYEYPNKLEFNFLSEDKHTKKKIIYEDSYNELPIRSALVVFDFFAIDGSIDTNIVSFLQIFNSPEAGGDVSLQYEIEKGSWRVKATGYVTQTRFFVTTKTKVQLSTSVAKKQIANKVACEYEKELKKLDADNISVEKRSIKGPTGN